MTLPHRTANMSAALVLALMSAQAACAQDTQGSALTAGLGWSSLHGTVASVGLEAMNIRDSGFDASVTYRRGDTGMGGQAKLRYSRDLGDTAFGTDTKAEVRLNYSGSDWQDQDFSSETSRLTMGLASKRPQQQFVYRAELFLQQDHHFGASKVASPLVLAELGNSTAGGLILGLGAGSLGEDDLLGQGYAVDGSVTASFLGDRHFAALDLRTRVGMPLDTKSVLLLKAESGVIGGMDGQDVSLHDRAFMGGTAPRGFAVGGAGPRDFVAGGVDSALGGNRYAFGSVEARREITPAVTLGLFADVGASWSLDQPVVGAMGAIDDRLHPRSSVGLSAYWTTNLGTMRFSVAKAVEHQPYDRLNPVSFDLVSKF